MAQRGFHPEHSRFLKGAGRWTEAPETGLPEVAVAGRSNVGKSSLINFLLGRRGLARTSCTPGRTQEMNFFEVDGRLVLADLPGYGYARAPRETVRRWTAAMAGYVRERPPLCCVLQLVDIRREPSAEDRAFAALVRAAGRPLLIAVTKADKVGRSQWKPRVAALAEALGVDTADAVLTSAHGRLGRAEVWKRVFALTGGAGDGATLSPDSALVVAIDGPSGAGKSTVARRLAARLGWNHIDTGAMYRAVGLKADRAGVPLDEDGVLAALCRETTLELRRREDGDLRVLLDGEDVSEAIREHRVSDLASRVSARRPVREAMARYQRELGLAAPSVLEGRDIGTVVFPDAFLKVFLTASDAERARRRAAELSDKGQAVDPGQVLADLRERDRADSTREHAPLRRADDAVEVSTDGLTAEEVVERLAALVEERRGRE